MAIDVLKSKGVPEDRILFINLIASPEGARSFADKYPKVRVVTAFVDQGLNEKRYVTSLQVIVVHHADPVPSASSCPDLETLVIDSTRCSTCREVVFVTRKPLLALPACNRGARTVIPSMKIERTDLFCYWHFS